MTRTHSQNVDAPGVSHWWLRSSRDPFRSTPVGVPPGMRVPWLGVVLGAVAWTAVLFVVLVIVVLR